MNPKFFQMEMLQLVIDDIDKKRSGSKHNPTMCPVCGCELRGDDYSYDGTRVCGVCHLKIVGLLKAFYKKIKDAYTQEENARTVEDFDRFIRS